MPAERFFIDQDLSSSSIYLIEGEEFLHLAKVMRARAGDHIEIVNGRGQLAQGVVQEIEKRCARLQVTSVETKQPLTISCTLAIAIPRLNRLEYILEKGTELGVTAFWLFPGNLSEKVEFTTQQTLRMRNLTTAALKQCGRLDLPSIEIKPPLAKWPVPQGFLLFGDTRSHAPSIASLSPPPSTPIIFFSGCEKGFSPQELAILQDTFQAKGVSLSSYILRADTAPVVAASLLLIAQGK